MPRKLVVYSIPDDFSPETHIALGPWCFYQREDVYPDWDELTFVTPLDDPEHRARRADEAIQTANALLDELWPEMNRRHGCDHGRAFWHTMLMNWLMHLVMLSWRLWEQTEAFIAVHGDEAFEVAIDSRAAPFRFSTVREFILSSFGDSPFRRWLTHEIVRRQAPPPWRTHSGEMVTPPSQQMPQWVPPANWPPIPRIQGMSTFWLWVFSGFLELLPRRHRQAKSHPENQGYPVALPAGLKTLLHDLLWETMPISVSDELPTLKTVLAHQRHKPGRIRITTPTYHQDLTNLSNALAAEAGERIIMLQHGGTYGWARTMSMTGEMEFWQDSFLTWGWTQFNDYQGRFIPIPSPLIGRLVGRHQERDDRMILVGAAMYGINARIDNYPESVPYRKRKRQFIAALSPSMQGKLAYRPYDHDYHFDDSRYLHRFFPDLAIVKGDLTQAMLRAKLVVQDHHSTTLSLTLGANIPTIGIWDEHAWPLGRQGKPLFDRLKAAKIIFDDPAEAARHIERIWPDVQGWWRSPEVQEARKAWAAQFGWGSKWWWLHWLVRLPRL